MMSVRKVMSPEFMAGNCLAALQAHGLAAREETRRCEGRAECNSNGQIHININDPQVACIWLDTTLLEHRHASTCDILLWASVCKAWRFHIFARQPQALSPVQEPAFKETNLPPCSSSSVLRSLDMAVTDAIRGMDNRVQSCLDVTPGVEVLTTVSECIEAFPAKLIGLQDSQLALIAAGFGLVQEDDAEDGFEPQQAPKRMLSKLASEWSGNWQRMMRKLEEDGLLRTDIDDSCEDVETLCPIYTIKRRGRARELGRLLHSFQHALRRAGIVAGEP